MTQEYNASGKLDYFRVHRPNRAQILMNHLLPQSMQILGRLIYEAENLPNLLLNGTAPSNAGVWGQWTGTNGVTFQTSTSTTPNFDDPDGTYAQSGTTVTRSTGTGTFVSGDVGKELKFSTGQRCHIVTFTNSTTVTVSNSQTVAATTLRRYATNKTVGTPSQSSNSTGEVVATKNFTAGTAVRTWSTIFTAAVSGYTCGSVFISSNAACIVLPVPVVVAVNDQLSMSYSVQYTCASAGMTAHDISLNGAIAGWPVNYLCSAISGNGTTVTVTTSSAHHHLAGDEVVIANAIPLKKTVSSASASGSAWTINATGHGFSVSDTVVHEGFSQSGYNGTYTVATVTNANTYTVTNAANPGASTGGTTRFATPAGYFDGTYTVATAPNTTTITITSNKTGPAVDPSTVIKGSDVLSEALWYDPFDSYSSGSWQAHIFDEANVKTVPAYDSQTAPSTTGNVFSGTGAGGAIQNASYANDFTGIYSAGTLQTWSAGGSSVNRVKQIYNRFSSNSGVHRMLTLRTAQPKLSTHRFLTPSFAIKITRDLP